MTGTRVGELLFELNAQSHTTLILVTHDRELAGRCGRTIYMEAGRVIEGLAGDGQLRQGEPLHEVR